MAVWCSVARRSAAGAPCSIAHRVGSYNGGHRFVVGAHPVGDRTVTVLLHPSITERIAALATSWLRSVTHGAGSCNNAAAYQSRKRTISARALAALAVTAAKSPALIHSLATLHETHTHSTFDRKSVV